MALSRERPELEPLDSSPSRSVTNTPRAPRKNWGTHIAGSARVALAWDLTFRAREVGK
jgi:hypothetical protein